MAKVKWLLLVIFSLGLLLRIIGLNISPPGFNADEAALGYNAYSLSQTGLDEWGESWPLVFRSFADYKPGLYVYLAMPFVMLFGLTELAVRLPSILLGSLSILLIYGLSLEIFKRRLVAIAAAFVLAISPWHIHYSRGAWETNVATFFMLLGVYAFVRGLKQFNWFYLSVISLTLSMYAYQSTRVVVPLLGLSLLLLNLPKFKVKKTIGLVIVSIILILPLVIIMLSDKGSARFKGVSILSDPGPQLQVNEARGEDGDPNSVSALIFHNKFSQYALNFTGHYFDHYNLSFLFLSGDPLKRNNVPEMGQLYLWELITIIIGLVVAIKKSSRQYWIVWLWLIFSPVAAALTYQTPHALRAENMVIPLAILSGLGLATLIDWSKRQKTWLRVSSLLVVTIIIGLFGVRFIHQYYVHLPAKNGLEWQGGFSQAMNYINQHGQDSQQVIITDRYDQPYILLLFYSRLDPQVYQSFVKDVSDDNYGYSRVNGFDKYIFKRVNYEDVRDLKNTLFIITPDEAKGFTPTKVIYYPNQTPAFVIIKT